MCCSFCVKPAPADAFRLLCDGFGSSGGMFPADELASRVRLWHGQGVGLVARWIVDQTLVSIQWRQTYRIPAFQLCAPSCMVRPALGAVLCELPRPSDAWARALWFCNANGALDGARSADLFDAEPDRVRQAARLLRFALTG